MDKLTLLDVYSSDDLKVVKSDLEDHYEGIKNIYVIDTFDVINYTLPFINRGSFDDDFKLAFTTIFYENVFSIYKDFDIILADEYRQELSNILENFEFKIKNFSSIRDKLLSSINESIKSDSDTINKKILYNEFELIIVLYIFIEKGKNLFERFNQFVESLNIDDFKSKNINDIDSIINVFKETRPSKLTNKLIDMFAESQRYKLASIPTEYERYCYLDNTYRDISVVDRVFNINTKINNTIRVKYLSSTPQKTSELIKLLDQAEPNNKFNFHRNINQLFLLKHLTINNEGSKESIQNIDTLIKLKEIENQITKDSSEFHYLESINKSLDTLKKEITNDYFFDSYTYYDNLFKSVLTNEKVSKEDLVKIKRIIEKIDDNIPERLLTDKLSSRLKLNQVLSLSQKLNDSIESSTIIINTGDDIIKNTFHHLPYLIFYKINPSETISEFYNFLNSLSNKSELIGNSSKKYKNEVDNILSNISYKKLTLSKQIIDFMILTFLNLVTETQNKRTNEIELIELIESQVHILQKTKTSLKKENGKIIVVQNNDKHIDDFNYMLLWLYRRTKQYEDSKKIIERNKLYINSPRFIHGLGLTIHSEAYGYIDTGNLESALSGLTESKKLLMKSFELYQEFHSENLSLNKLIIKQKIGLLNTIIDANLRICEITNEINIDFIEESREYLNFIKNQAEKELNDIDYFSLETINHTESELEYYEALQYYNNKEYIESAVKLNYTVDRLKVISNSKTLIEERFRIIESKINDLRYKNLIALDII